LSRNSVVWVANCPIAAQVSDELELRAVELIRDERFDEQAAAIRVALFLDDSQDVGDDVSSAVVDHF
jgi:hypothetical protein